MRAHWGETLMGFVVLAFAGIFLAYALGVTGRSSTGSYEISARFGEAGGIQPGAKVTVSGVKVGAVSSVTIDPKTYMAVIRLSVDAALDDPSDRLETRDPQLLARAERWRPWRAYGALYWTLIEEGRDAQAA